MKINFFAVNNYRGISGGLENNKLDFKDTHTLFVYGQNNVGKSTILHAYEDFYFNTTPVKSDFFRSDTNNKIEMEIELFLEDLDKTRIEEAAPTKKESYKKYLFDSKLRLKKTWLQGAKGISVLNETFNPTTGVYDPKGYASIGLPNVFQSCMPKPIFIKAMPGEDEIKSILNTILEEMAVKTLGDKELQAFKDAKEKIEELQGKMYSPKLMESYESSINTYFSKVFSDTSLSIKEEKTKFAWTEKKLGKTFNVDFVKLDSQGKPDKSIPTLTDNVGHGAIRTAIFTLLLMKDIAEGFERKEGRKDYMVLFEEPELFLYPKVARELRELIYQVSSDDLPYQVLCASHSPSMVDLSKPKSSLIRLVKSNEGTKLHQINDSFLMQASGAKNLEQLKQEMYEVLRFNPHMCEAFYSDEVILIEGPTEEIICRAYLQQYPTGKDIFILNCGTVNNIPFYQAVLSKFNIKYHVICDTDKASTLSKDKENNPIMGSGIQKTISDKFAIDKAEGISGLMRVHDVTFEPAHQAATVPEVLRYREDAPNKGKPLNANLYWKNVIIPNLDHPDLGQVPIISFLNEITSY